MLSNGTLKFLLLAISSCGDDESLTSFYGNTVRGRVERNSLRNNSDHMTRAGTAEHIRAVSCRLVVSIPAGAPWGDIRVGGMPARVP